MDQACIVCGYGLYKGSNPFSSPAQGPSRQAFSQFAVEDIYISLFRRSQRMWAHQLDRDASMASSISQLCVITTKKYYISCKSLGFRLVCVWVYISGQPTKPSCGVHPCCPPLGWVKYRNIQRIDAPWITCNPFKSFLTHCGLTVAIRLDRKFSEPMWHAYRNLG